MVIGIMAVMKKTNPSFLNGVPELLVLRLLWRWANPVPALPGDLKPWERTAAHLGHFGLYVLMLATTLTGWAMAGTGRVPLRQDLLGIEIEAFLAPVPS